MAEIIESPKPFGNIAKGIAQHFFRHENAVLAIVLTGIMLGVLIIGVVNNRMSLLGAGPTMQGTCVPLQRSG